VWVAAARARVVDVVAGGGVCVVVVSLGPAFLAPPWQDNKIKENTTPNAAARPRRAARVAHSDGSLMVILATRSSGLTASATTVLGAQDAQS